MKGKLLWTGLLGGTLMLATGAMGEGLAPTPSGSAPCQSDTATEQMNGNDMPSLPAMAMDGCEAGDSMGEASRSELEERARKQALWDEERAAQGLLPLTKTVAGEAGESGEFRSPRANKANAAPRVSNIRMVASSTPGIMLIYYDLDVPSNKKCTVSLRLSKGYPASSVETIPALTLTGAIGRNVNPGRNRCIEWNAKEDWPNQYSEQVYATVSAEESSLPSAWVSVKIEWASYKGRDLDICAYWTDKPGQKVGWNWGTAYSDIDWGGDNTGYGPEYVSVSSDRSSGRRLRIHFNYYGTPGSPCHVIVREESKGLPSLPMYVRANGSRTGSRAETSDPGVEITFGDLGEVVSIKSIN